MTSSGAVLGSLLLLVMLGYSRRGQPISWGCSIVFYLVLGLGMVTVGLGMAAHLPLGAWLTVAAGGLGALGVAAGSAALRLTLCEGAEPTISAANAIVIALAVGALSYG